MGKHRTAVVLTALALSLLGVAPAQADDANLPLIQGVVVDQFGSAVDNVNVEATRPTGEVAASSLTYASQWPNGPQHGYFFLAVGHKGDFTLTFERPGFAPLEMDDVLVKRRLQRVSLGELTMTRLVPTSTTATLTDNSIPVGDRGEVSFKTVSKQVTPVPGEAKVTVDGDKVDTVTLKKGSGRLTLPRLGAGTHDVQVLFLGDPDTGVLPSKSKPVELTVTKKKRHHHRFVARPNAW